MSLFCLWRMVQCKNNKTIGTKSQIHVPVKNKISNDSCNLLCKHLPQRGWMHIIQYNANITTLIPYQATD